MIVYVSGYSRVGKTTFLNHMRELGAECFSTSEYLNHLATVKYMEDSGIGKAIAPEDLTSSEEYLSVYDALTHKDDVFLGLSARQFKIDLAERDIVVRLGREEGLVVPVVKQIKESKSPLIFVEVFNLEEQLLFDKYLYYKVHLNITNNRHTDNSDGRVLLENAYTLENVGSLEEYKSKIVSLFNFFTFKGCSKIAYDLDGVVFSWKHLLNSFGLSISEYYTNKSFMDRLVSLMGDYPDSYSTLLKMQDYPRTEDHIFVTARCSESIKVTGETLGTHSRTTYFVHGYKDLEVGFDVIVDDSPNACLDPNRLVLYNQPYNIHRTDLRRVGNLSEFKALLEMGEK